MQMAEALQAAAVDSVVRYPPGVDLEAPFQRQDCHSIAVLHAHEEPRADVLAGTPAASAGKEIVEIRVQLRRPRQDRHSAPVGARRIEVRRVNRQRGDAVRVDRYGGVRDGPAGGKIGDPDQRIEMAKLGVNLKGGDLCEQSMLIGVDPGIGGDLTVNCAVAAFEQFANAQRDPVVHVFDSGQLVSSPQSRSAPLGCQPTVLKRSALEVRDVERHGGVDSGFHDGRRMRDGEVRRAMVGTKIDVDGRCEGAAELVARPVRSYLLIDAIQCRGAQPLGKVDDVAPSLLMGRSQPRPLINVGPRIVVRAPPGEVRNDANLIAHLGDDRGRREREPDARHRVAL